MHPAAARLIADLDLAPHPEGGWFREIWRTGESIATPRGARSAGTSILYLLAGGAVSRLHRLTGDEVWYLHAGGPVRLHLLEEAGTRILLLDAAGDPPVFQAVVPGGTWFGADLVDAAGYALVGCAMAPGFDGADFEMGHRHELLGSFPEAREVIMRLTTREDPT